MMDKVKKGKWSSLTIKPESMKSLRDITLETIREAIVSGHFVPGEHLKERELSQAMGMSTTPIKESFRILSHEGLVETIPRKGTFVSSFVNTSIVETLKLKSRLEGLAVSLAAEKITNEELAALEAKVIKMERLAQKDDADQLVVENTAFHAMIRDAARNPMVSQMLLNVAVFDSTFRKRALQLNVEVKEGFSEHRQIFEAIKQRNPDLAETRMKTHIMRTGVCINDDDGLT